MAKTIKVEIPRKKPDDTLELCDFILEKDTADGAASPLDDLIDMVVFGGQVALAKGKRLEAANKDHDAEGKFDVLATKAGLAKGQTKYTKDTIGWYARQVRDILLVKHSGTEEEMSRYGYNVVVSTTGARKNVRVDIPINIEDMVKLGKDIVAQHTLLGVGSPLTVALVDMAAFETLVTDSEVLLHDWKVLRDSVESLNGEAINLLGYGAGQTISTNGTIYHELSKIRTRLLQKFAGDETKLHDWHFPVKVSNNFPGRKKVSVKISIQGKVTDKVTHAPIVNAVVHVVEPDLFTTTDAEGKFAYYALTPGTYTVQAYKAGYPDFTAEGVQVKASALTLNIEMEIVTSVVLEGDLPMGNTIELTTNNFTLTPSSTVAVETNAEIVISASDTAGPALGPVQWHVFTLQNKTADAYKALIGLDATHTHVKVQCGPLNPAHYKITFKNITML